MPDASTVRPDPEQLLRQVEAEEEHQRRGRLKIFLGYSSGVGKSFRMLDEGRRRHERGEDVVVGAIQPVTSPDVQRVLENLEIIPMKTVDDVAVMDVDVILNRHPQVCLVDGLAYDNPAGRARPKRWQDAEQLLQAGISVIGTVNLQHIEEYRAQVEKITGKKVKETIPLGFVNKADEIEVVDAPPELCLERAAYTSPNGAATPSQQQLSELREIALILVADAVDRQLAGYLERHGIEQLWGAQERVLVCITPRVNAKKMIESGRRNADRFHGELFVVYVNEPELTGTEQETLAANLEVARQHKAQIELLESEEPIDAIIDFARTHGITQIFIGHSTQETWWHRLRGNFVDRLIRDAEGIDVRVFPN
ncbi:MAG TPA: universal stress protein [Terriglobia bacterium]|nr:universal stress protein [Terriglobia bacterium]